MRVTIRKYSQKNMKEIRRLIRRLINEVTNLEHSNVNVQNFKELYQKLVPIVHDAGNDMRVGLKFIHDNIDQYEDDPFIKGVVDNYMKDINRLIREKRPNFFDQFDTGYTGHKFMGVNYDKAKNMSKKEIADLIRAELRARFPDWKFHIRTKLFSGGGSIDVDIKYVPYNPYTPEAQEYLMNNKYYEEERGGAKKYIEQFEQDKKKIKSVISQYKMDDSDGMIDYFHVNFYDSLNVDEYEIQKVYLPDSLAFKSSKEFKDSWDAAAKKRKEEADALKGKYKKGEEVIYMRSVDWPSVPKGEYRAVVLKSPNGRSKFLNYYSIKVYVNKVKKNGVLVDRETPITVTLDSVREKEIRRSDETDKTIDQAGTF